MRWQDGYHCQGNVSPGKKQSGGLRWGPGVGESACPKKWLKSRIANQSLAAEIAASTQSTFFSLSLTFHAIVGNHAVTLDTFSLNNKALDSGETLLHCPPG